MNVNIYQIMDWIVLIYCFDLPFLSHDKAACVAMRHNRLCVATGRKLLWLYLAIHNENSWIALLSFNKTIIQFTYCHL